nr:DNA/RNA non-specific endonuclease [Conchiformibius steedae]
MARSIAEKRMTAKKYSLLGILIPMLFFLVFKLAGVVYEPLRVGGKNKEVQGDYAVRATAAASNDYPHYVFTAGQQAGCRQHYPLGAPQLDNENSDNKAALLCYQQFTLHFDAATKTPLWASYVLDTDDWWNKPVSTPAAWQPDPNILKVSKPTAVYPQQYAHSGLLPVPLAPPADFAFSAQAVQQSLWTTNAVPQNPAAVQTWQRLNQAVRGLLGKKQQNARLERLYVVSGVVYKPIKGVKPPKNGEPRYYTFNGIQTPTYFYKAVLHPKSGRSIAFLIPNTADAANMDLKAKGVAMTIQQLERETRMVFFPNINEPKAKMNTALLEWL